jgi:hypothetical protein
MKCAALTEAVGHGKSPQNIPSRRSTVMLQGDDRGFDDGWLAWTTRRA